MIESIHLKKAALTSFMFTLCVITCIGLSACSDGKYESVLRTLPTMPGATQMRKDIQPLDIPDAGAYASLGYHVTASWRQVMSFYEKELLQQNWQELVYYKKKGGPPMGRYTKYLRDRSTILQVSTYPGNVQEPDKVVDQKVTLIIKFIKLCDGCSYIGYEQPYTPSLPGSIDDVPVFDPKAWKPWKIDQFDVTIPLPPGWQYAAGYQKDGGLNLLEGSGTVVATLYCPIPEVGFEAWDFKTQSETFEKDGQLHGKTLWIGTARPGTDVGNFNILFIHRNSFDHWLDDPQHSCMITSSGQKDLLEEMYKRIQ